MRRPPAGALVAVVALSVAVAGSAVGAAETMKRAVKASQVRSVAKRQATKALDAREGKLVTADAVGANGNASTEGIDNFTSSAFTTVLSEPFHVARDGHAVITASVGAADDATISGAGMLAVRVAVDGTARFSDPFNAPTHVFYREGSGGSSTNTAVVPVSAGSHTAELQIREAGTGSFVFTRQISVFVVPR